MTDIKAQVIIKTVDNVSENFISNTFSFDAVSPTAASTDITPLIKDFYDDFVGYLSPVIAQNAHEIKWYDRSLPAPNYPYDMTGFNLSSQPAGQPLPEEVALCLSFQGSKFAGAPQARRRGRIYIGPLDSTANDTGGRPIAAFRTALANAAQTFGAAVDALSPAVSWAVWSDAAGSSTVLVDGWIDNSWDTQRRRGVKPTARTTFVL